MDLRKYLLNYMDFHDILGNQNNFYGNISIAAKYCSLPKKVPPIPGIWPHGWHIPMAPIVAGDYTEGNISYQLFVWNEIERNKALNLGYSAPVIVGSPFIYITEPNYAPDNNSLFVAPYHSYWGIEKEWDFFWEKYASYLKKLTFFNKIIICLHWNDYSNNNTRSIFEDCGFNVVLGAKDGDDKSLLRIFSYIGECGYGTTNQVGTILWYMAYSGLKIFFSGPLPVCRNENFLDISSDEWWTQHPNIALTTFNAFPNLPKLYDISYGYKNAKKIVDLGIQELGYSYKKDKCELRSLFNWTDWRLLMHRFFL